MSRLDGTDLRYNQPDPYLPDLVIYRPELAEAVLAALPTAWRRLSVDGRRSTPTDVVRCMYRKVQ